MCNFRGFGVSAATAALWLATVPALAEDIKLAPITVPKIKSADVVVLTSDPGILRVTAYGEVPTSGIQGTTLTRVIYVMPPGDGIQDYVMTSLKPDGIVAPVLTPVKASDEWPDFQQEAPWLKGIRIHGVGKGVYEKKFENGLAGIERYSAEGRQFTGTSNDGDMQKALADAIEQAHKALTRDMADGQIDWTLKAVNGVRGGFANHRSISVTITAELN
ncbi:MAG: hypothetical protein KF774_11905 [Planctomyces sp.]|nr:hypothetical protein [Planctomyces sp.]